MQKEIIYFSAFSMMEPDSVELLENNKGSISSMSDRNKIVDIPDYKILNFWDKLDEIGVWKWNDKYPIKDPELEQLTDGYTWEIKLRNRVGRAKFCSGYMSFPKKFKYLIKELNNLFGSNIRY